MPGSPAKFPTSRRRLEALWRPGWRLIGSYMITSYRKWMTSLTGQTFIGIKLLKMFPPVLQIWKGQNVKGCFNSTENECRVEVTFREIIILKIFEMMISGNNEKILL